VTAGAARSEPYRASNLLDTITSKATRAEHDRHLLAREHEVLARRVPLTGGTVLSIGCGWNPGRHLFPAPEFRLVGVDSDPAKVAGVLAAGRVDEAHLGVAGALMLPEQSFDVVLYRLVLHHIAYQGPLEPCFREAARLLTTGGALVVIEPGLWHPVGAALAAANRLGVATAIHGTPDDVPLSPRELVSLARRAGLAPELHALTYTWRRMPPALQRALGRLDPAGSRPRAARLGHTLMLIARRAGSSNASPISR
jgi:SAM-dependent methyltransferase